MITTLYEMYPICDCMNFRIMVSNRKYLTNVLSFHDCYENIRQFNALRKFLVFKFYSFTIR